MDELTSVGLPVSPTDAASVLLRLVVALALGGVVAFIYKRTRAKAEVSDSFSVTLVLLAVLIAMVTQVIGNSVARAFSLVGALSIVRFRTVVRDTQDTAYVIFSVAVGMAVGASNAAVALSGIVVVAMAAYIMRSKSRVVTGAPADALPFELTVRMGLGVDPDSVLAPTLDRFSIVRQLSGVATIRQGLAVEVGYRVSVDEGSSAAVVNALNQIQGVQGVTLRRIEQAD